jgi:hypothetical protein
MIKVTKICEISAIRLIRDSDIFPRVRIRLFAMIKVSKIREISAIRLIRDSDIFPRDRLSA